MNSDKEPNIAINRHLLLTLLAVAFALGVFVGAGMGLFTSSPAGKGDAAPESKEGIFRFIRASVGSNSSGKNLATKELKPFQYKINALIENTLKNGDASVISVYFRDLNNGNWFGIREHDTFSPKSLLKVPLMIAYFKWAESNPSVLRRTLPSSAKAPETVQSKDDPVKKPGSGKAATINTLIFRMIAHDDAEAYALLYENLPANRLEKVFDDLDVEYDPHKQEDTLSLNAFASFFRVLYNSSYLSEEMSEKALRYLSKSSFLTGMVAGIPPNIDIASKHGERKMLVITATEEKELSQLHEFEIIYHPHRPFLLGVMVRGSDFDRMTKIARDITRLVYEEVDKQS